MPANLPKESSQVKPIFEEADLDLTIPDIIAVVPRLAVPLGFEWCGRRYVLWPETSNDEAEARR